MKIDPKEIKGTWVHGWALDVHIISSTFDGPNEWGYPSFSNTYSEIGGALHKLKYRDDRSQVDPIAQSTANFIRSKQELSDVSAIIAAHPSDTTRSFQPVSAIANVIGAKLGILVLVDYLQKIKQTSSLKNMSTTQERRSELQSAFKVVDEKHKGRHILVFDDLFDSGATLNAICDVLISQGKVGKVSVVTVTITRAKR